MFFLSTVNVYCKLFTPQHYIGGVSLEIFVLLSTKAPFPLQINNLQVDKLVDKTVDTQRTKTLHPYALQNL